MVALRHSLPILICLLKQHYRITGAQSTYDARIQFTFRNLFSDYSQITFPEDFSKRQHAGYHSIKQLSSRSF